MMGFLRHGWVAFVVSLVWAVCPAAGRAQENLLANPDFETLAPNGFFADWGQGSLDKVDKLWFVERQTPPSGKLCLRMQGTPGTWTTCPSKPLTVQPDRDYWITWRFRATQPNADRSYLFLQTNLGQRVFTLTDGYGEFAWTQNIVKYRTKPGETRLQLVLAMQSGEETPGTSWWDDLGVWDRLTPELTTLYRQEHPWDDVRVVSAQRLGQAAGCEVWGDCAEVRIGPKTPIPAGAGTAEKIRLAAPGRGHDVYQLVVAPNGPLNPISLEFSAIQGPAKLPASTLSYRVVRCVPVQKTRDKAFPLGPTPDPLVEPSRPEAAQPGENLVFWIEWAPPPQTAPGDYTAKLTIRQGKKPLLDLALELHRWAFDLASTSQYRSLVHITPSFIQRFYPERSEEDVLRLAWRLLSSYRLSGFNLSLWPEVSVQNGRLEFEWTKFDRMLAFAREYRANALTVGPMFGGGSGQGWRPHKFAGLTPLADKEFDLFYVQFNRSLVERLRQSGLYDISYFYPYDEPEPDYMDKVARLFDLMRQSDPNVKCFTTVDPKIAGPLWGKTAAWCIPSSRLKPDVLPQCRALGDEVWLYNMTAAIEDSPLDHRLFMWMCFQAQARGGLLWNSCWWNQINPWENPTAESVPVGRKAEGLYHYQAGQASLFYPAPDGKGPLVPSLRLALIRQGVEDFDILTQLAAARENLPARFSAEARKAKVTDLARQAMVAPVMLDMVTGTTCPARLEAVRQIAASELEVASQRPSVIVYPARTADGQLGVIGYAEPDTVLKLSGREVTLDQDSRFEIALTAEQWARGLQWSAEKVSAAKIAAVKAAAVKAAAEKADAKKGDAEKAAVEMSPAQKAAAAKAAAEKAAAEKEAIEKAALEKTDPETLKDRKTWQWPGLR